VTTTDGPLSGCRVVVCRAADQAAGLVASLRRAGAEPVLLPLIRVEPPLDDGAHLQAALGRLERYSWVLFTSANGVRAVVDHLGRPAWPAGVRVGAVGRATAAAAREAGIPIDLALDSGTGADLARAVPPPVGGPVLLPAAELAGPALADGLTSVGWQVERVTAYRTVTPTPDPVVLDAVTGADAVLFTSASTVDRFVEVVGPPGPGVAVVCIGAVTADRARRRGLEVTAVADHHSDDGLVRALVEVWPPGRPPGSPSL
jgi:uroporphyrinogen-III synthase